MVSQEWKPPGDTDLFKAARARRFRQTSPTATRAGALCGVCVRLLLSLIRPNLRY